MTLAVTLTVDDLRKLVREAVREELARASGAVIPESETKQEIQISEADLAAARRSLERRGPRR